MTNPTDAVTTTNGFAAEAIGICLETLQEDPTRSQANDLLRSVRAASGAGFTAVTLCSWRAADIGIANVRGMLGDAGLSVRLTECRTRWAEGPIAATEFLDAHLDIVEALGADRILAVSQQTTIDISRAAEGLAALCEGADQRKIRVSIEFIPCRGLCDLSTAWEVIRRSGASNGGLVVDMMHWQNQKGGPNLELLRTIPAHHLHYVQICDAAHPGPPAEDYINVALHARPLPGDGVVDIAALLATLRATGADPFLAMEVYNSGLLSEGPDVMAKRLRRAAESL